MVIMSVSIEKVLADARLLVNRLKSHDSYADSLLNQTTMLHKRLESMKEYEEDMNELNEIARHRPRANLILGLAQENSQIRELQQENRELRASLEEHQSAIELIMKKYRDQVAKLLMTNKLDTAMTSSAPVVSTTRPLDHVMASSAPVGELMSSCNTEQIDKICEMVAVMRQAIAMDERVDTSGQQQLVQLQHENKTLRELLQISSTATRHIPVDTDEKHTQTSKQDVGVSTSQTELAAHDPLGDSVGSVTSDVEAVLRELDLPEEGDLDDEDESESDANDSVLSTDTIKRCTIVRCKTDSESSGRDADSLTDDLKPPTLSSSPRTSTNAHNLLEEAEHFGEENASQEEADSHVADVRSTEGST